MILPWNIVVTHLLWPSVAVILSARLELMNNDPTLEHCRTTSTMAFNGSDSVSSFRASEQ